jgi:thiosulfate/3-mercaptopyruvate sulfurtransferase
VTLIEVAELIHMIGEDDPPTVLDVRWRLGGPPGRESYVAGHIAGARFVDLDSELCGAPGAGGRHPLPEPTVLQEVLRRAGVRHDHPVVAYDWGDMQAAARLWWTLRWAGHPDVRVLDGGFAAWTRAGHQVVTGEEPSPSAGDFEVKPGHLRTVDADGAAALATDAVLIDVRTRPRYLGDDEPVDPVAGRVPGAVNLPAAELLAPDGRLKSADELRARFEAAGVRAGTPVGAYCGSGVAAAGAVLALNEAGFPDALLYVGSWSHWVTDRGRTVATGEPR